MQRLLQESEQVREKTIELGLGTNAVRTAVAAARQSSEETIRLAVGVTTRVEKFQLKSS